MSDPGPFVLIAAGLLLLTFGLLVLHSGRTSGPRLAVYTLVAFVVAVAFTFAQAAVFPTFHDRYDNPSSQEPR